MRTLTASPTISGQTAKEKGKLVEEPLHKSAIRVMFE
jgi:hypothetical protein